MTSRSRGPGAPVLALLAILVVTGAWWALALWPAGPVEPGWLERTRAACFGSVHGGLPDAGGWILLIGEPVGMVGVLFAVWGRALREDLTRLAAIRPWRVAGVGILIAGLLGLGLVGWRVRSMAVGAGSLVGNGLITSVRSAAPTIPLIDQQGQSTSLADMRGRPTLLTFAFGHCGTVCPLTVHDALVARSAAPLHGLRLVVLTLDPWRDTPERLATLARQWNLGPEDQVLSGPIPDVERTLDLLGVGRRRDTLTGDIEHGRTVMLLDGTGRIVGRLDGGWGRIDALLATVAIRP